MSLGLLLQVTVLQWLALAAIMAVAWAVQRRTGNSGWIDAIWTLGLGAVGAVSVLLPGIGGGSDAGARQALVAALIAVWALRLGGHLIHRSANKPDDPRYAALIEGWGRSAPRGLFMLLQKQALVSVPLALTMHIAASKPGPGLGLADFAAVALCLLAVAGEGVADRQLRSFIATRGSRSGICNAGLWRYSRHPNYFFEWLYWVAYPVIAIDLSLAYPWGFLALAGPVTMYWLLRYVSGVPPLEEHMVRKHGAAYRAYQRSTNAFFPGPTRHD